MAEIRPALADLDSLAILEDPYPAYRALREADPVHLMPSGKWYLTRYDDVATIFTDKRFCRAAPEGFALLEYERRESTTFDEMIAKWMLFMDPPAHTRLRQLVNGWFTPRRIENMRPAIQSIVDDLLNAVENNRSLEFVSDFAYPLPVIVISRILGVPREDYGRFRQVSQQLNKAIDTGRMEDAAGGRDAIKELKGYFEDQIARRRKAPEDDLISYFLSAQTQDAAGDDDEMASTCIMLLFAGHETTKNLISSAILTLIRNPAQQNRLQRDPELISSAVEEFLRFESPVQKTGRWTREDVAIGGKTIPKDRLVVGVIAAANRDPEKFPDPDQLDIARNDGAHLAFGRGAHHCTGNLLARIEAQIAINTLLRRLPRLALASERPEWQETLVIRGMKKLPVTVERR
ncbi:MAG: cytochrome P450 [Alphaproteobacteria bacterium]